MHNIMYNRKFKMKCTIVEPTNVIAIVLQLASSDEEGYKMLE